MKTFIQRILIFGTTLFFCVPLSIAIYDATDKDRIMHMEDEAFVKKITFFEDSLSAYNTVFIGSSQVYRHINPSEFDSITGCTRSFNLGYPGVRPTRSFEVVNRVVQETGNLKYVFFELKHFETLKSNYKSAPVVNSISFANYKIVMRSIFHSNYDTMEKFKYYASYTRSLFYKYIGTGVLSEIFTQEDRVFNSFDEYEYAHNGYYPLDLHFADDPTNEDLVFRKNELLEKTARLEQMKRESMDSTTTSTDLNPYTIYLLNLHARLAAKGVKLFFIKNPKNIRLKNLEFINMIEAQLGNDKVIDLSNGARYPEFYELENSFDLVHFNGKGAKIYTQKLAEAFHCTSQ